MFYLQWSDRELLDKPRKETEEEYWRAQCVTLVSRLCVSMKSKDHAGSLTNRTDITAVGCHFLLCHLFCFVDKKRIFLIHLWSSYRSRTTSSVFVCVWSCDEISENFPAKTKKRRTPRSELISPDITKYIPMLCLFQFNHHIAFKHCLRKTNKKEENSSYSKTRFVKSRN